MTTTTNTSVPLPDAHRHPYWCNRQDCTRLFADGDTTHQTTIGEVKDVKVFIERIDDLDENGQARTGKPRMRIVSPGIENLNDDEAAELEDAIKLARIVLGEVSR